MISNSHQDQNDDDASSIVVEASHAVFSPVSLFVLISTTLVISFLMVPSDEEAARRLLGDGQVQRAAAVIRRDIVTPASETEAKQLSEVDALNLLDAMLQSDGRATDIPAQAAKFNHLLAALTDLTKVDDLLMRHRDELDPSIATSLFLSLGDLALQRGLGADAVSAYGKALESAPTNETVILKIVQAWRAQGKADKALAALEDLLKQTETTTSDTGSMLDLHVTLLRENNQSSRAMDLVLPTLHDPPTDAEVTLVAALAGESSRTVDGIPVLVKHIESAPGGHELLTDNLMDVPAKTMDLGLMDRGLLLATYYEWQDEPSKAFSIHYKLALAGEHESLKRCIALYDGLDRENDLCQLLQHLPAKALKPTEEHLLATLLAHSGNAAAAITHFESFLKSHPHDVEALGEVASIYSANNDLEGAAKVIEEALKQAPHNRALLCEYGDLLISTGRPRDALPVYEELSREPKDDESLERFALLAENLEEPALLAEALTREIAITPKPCPDLQLALVRTMMEMDSNETNAVAFLSDAVKGSPEQPCLRLALAKLLVQTPRAEEAVPLLTTTDLANSAESIELLCEAVQNGADTRRVADYFKAHVAMASITIAPEYQESRRQITLGETARSSNGQEKASGGGMPDLEDRLDRLREEAAKSYESGNSADAYAKISSYFEKTPYAHPSDWNLLGHIYKSMGQTEKSRKAFQKSLQPLTPTPTAASTQRGSAVSTLP